MNSRTILIVEDEEHLLDVLVKKIEDEGGFNVLRAKNGKVGLSAALKEHPDLIILDVIMPKMDGMTMAEELRKDEWGKYVPIVFLTNASLNEKSLRRLIKSKASYYLIKTQCDLDIVVRKAKELLDETDSFGFLRNLK